MKKSTERMLDTWAVCAARYLSKGGFRKRATKRTNPRKR